MASTKSWKKMTSLCRSNFTLSSVKSPTAVAGWFHVNFMWIPPTPLFLQVWGTGRRQRKDEPACLFQGAPLKACWKLYKHHAVWPAFTHHRAQTQPPSRCSVWQDPGEDRVRPCSVYAIHVAAWYMWINAKTEWVESSFWIAGFSLIFSRCVGWYEVIWEKHTLTFLSLPVAGAM